MNRVLCVSLLLFVAATVAPAQKPGGVGGQPPAFHMGFVDMERLIKEHPTTRLKTAELGKELRDRLEKLKLQRDEMRSIGDSLDLYGAGSPEYLAQLKRLKKLEATIEIEQRLIKMEFQLKIVDSLKEVYERCRVVVAEVAKERGYSSVAMVSSSAVRGRTRSELVGDILTRPFVFHKESLDITGEVLLRLKK